MDNSVFLNKNLLHKIYLRIFLKTTNTSYKFDDQSEVKYIIYKTDIIENNGIFYRFIISREYFLFNYVYHSWVEISSNCELRNPFAVYFKKRKTWSHVKNMFKILLLEKEDEIIKKYIPSDFLRSEKLSKIKKIIK